MAGGPTVNLADRVLHLRRAVRDVRQPQRPRSSTRRSSKVEACVVPAAEDGRVVHAPSDPVSPGRAGRAAGRRPDRVVQRHPDPRLDQLQRPDPQQRRTAPRRSSSSATAGSRHPAPPTPWSRRGPPTRTTRPELDPVGFLGVAPDVTSVTTGGPLYTHRADGRTRQAVGRRRWPRCRSRSGAWPRRSSASRPRAADSPVSIVGGGRLAGETVSAPGLPARGEAGRSCWRWSPASTSSSACSTSCRCCRWTAATSPARSGRRCAAASPGCAAGPTRATSTSPGCCPIAYVVASFLLVMGVVLIVGDLVVPRARHLTPPGRAHAARAPTLEA